MSTDAMAATPPPASDYPLRYDVEYPDHLNRWLNNPFLLWIKFILAIPNIIVLYFILLVVYVIFIIASFAILFTGKYPRGMFNFVVGYQRWSANLGAYILMLRDDYPPFSMDSGKYPLTMEVDYPESLSRWLNNPFLLWIKFILLIPHLIVLILLVLIEYVVFIIAGFAILFTGKFPRGMFDYVVGVNRWGLRVNMYAYMMTDKYPPFSMK